MLLIEKEGCELALHEFEKLTGAKWIPKLEFEDPPVLADIVKSASKLHKKGEMTLEQMWLGKYFQKEISNSFVPDVAIRWIDPMMGWGVFALRDFRDMQFIAEYTGAQKEKGR